MAAASHRHSSIETAVVDALLTGHGSPGSLLDSEFFAAFEEIAARRRAVDATLVEMIAELQARDETRPRDESLARAGGYRSPAEAAARLLAVRRGEAKTLCTLAEAIRSRRSVIGEALPAQHPAIAAALSEARLSVAQAAAIAAGLDEAGGRVDPELLDVAESELVGAACGLNPEDDAPASPEELAVQAAAWVLHLDPDGAEPTAQQQIERRGLWFTRRQDGTVYGKIIATPEQAELLQKSLDAYVAPRQVRFRPSNDACNAYEQAASTEPAGDGEGTGAHEPQANDGMHSDAGLCDDRTMEQRRIDALVIIVGNEATRPDAPRTGGEAGTVVITVTREGLADAANSPADVPHLERSGDPVPISTVARIMCDGFVRVALVDDHGETLKLGRKKRLFTTAQRRALAIRDRGCRAPGCNAPINWCEAHHVRPWSHGGPTDTDWGIMLCTFHHQETHRGALRIIRGEEGRLRVVPTFAHPAQRRRQRRITRSRANEALLRSWLPENQRRE